MVFRKSEYVDDRTVVVRSNKAAYDINREIIERLASGAILEVFIIVVLYGEG